MATRLSAPLALLIAACTSGDGSLPAGSESSTGEGEGGSTLIAASESTESGGAPGVTTSTSDDPSSADGLDPCAIGPEPGVIIGHGAGTFMPIDSGPAELVHGPQGGVHILVGIRAWQLDASDVAIARMTGTIDGELLGASSPYADLVCTGDGTAQQALALPLIWDVNGDALHMRTATITLELTDIAGTVVSTSADAIIIDPLLQG